MLSTQIQKKELCDLWEYTLKGIKIMVYNKNLRLL